MTKIWPRRLDYQPIDFKKNNYQSKDFDYRERERERERERGNSSQSS